MPRTAVAFGLTVSQAAYFSAGGDIARSCAALRRDGAQRGLAGVWTHNQ
ncbi:hypothetical protein [Yoonia sp.]|nr:hypothetical protein [Yoonia sp.]